MMEKEIEKVEEDWLLKLGADLDFRESEMKKMIEILKEKWDHLESWTSSNSN